MNKSKSEALISGSRWSAASLKRLANATIQNPEATLVVTVLVGGICGGMFVSSDVLTFGNASLLMQSMIPQLAVGLGVSIALYAGIIDLSIGSTMLVGAMTFALATHSGQPVPVCCAYGLLAGAAVGLLNSVLVVRYRVDSVVATLVTLLGIQGLAFVLGDQRSQASSAFSWDLFVATQIGIFPVLFLILTLLYIAATILMRSARVGRHMMAVGGGPTAARRLGIQVSRIQVAVLVFCGLLAAVGGVLAVGVVGSAPLTLGALDVFLVYSGILLGGFSLDRGGVGSPIGGLLGIVALSLMLNILSNASVSPGWQDIAVGLVLMIAVILDRLRYGAYSPLAVS
jgi:ribose/xylose/arabinose/galactoside ABC-type transport system permease subunit